MKNLRDVCPNCLKELEKQYEICVQYLRKHRGADIQELSDATDISIKEITRFIREGRISIMNAPNMMYPCEVCGVLIRDGHMCDSCRSRLTKDLHSAAHPETLGEGSEARKDGAYRVVDKRRET